MGINRQDSRHRIKRSNLTGVVPTAHTASTDFTDGTWLNTDLREAEFFYNIPDKKLWIGTGTSSIEIAQIGSTTSGNSLAQTLNIGNDSGANNIIMGTGTNIHSADGGGRIDLDAYGTPNTILITTDNAAEAESVIYLDNSSISLTTNANAESISIGGGKITEKATTIKLVAGYPSMLPIPSTPGSLYLSAGTGSVYMASDVVMASNKSIKSSNGASSISLDYAGVGGDILLSTDGSILADKYIWLGLPNIQIINQTGDIILDSSNTIKLNTAASISLLGNAIGLYNQSTNYGVEVTSGAVSIFDDDYYDVYYGGVTVKFNNSAVNLSTSVPINFDTYTTLKNTATIPGTLNQFDIKSSVGTATASIQLTTGLSTTIVSTVQGTSTTTTQEISENGGLKMSHTSGSDSGLTYQKIGAVSTTTVGTFSMASITFMANDQSFSIRGQANGYCASPNRNMGATFYASFLKYGGTIYQNGTTDIVLKDGYGDGTTPKVWTDGTNIYISVRTFSALTSTFTTSYEILV